MLLARSACVQIRLRLTPEIRFVIDDSMEHTERIYQLLDQVKRIQAGEAEPPPLAIEEFNEELEEEEDGDDGDAGKTADSTTVRASVTA